MLSTATDVFDRVRTEIGKLARRLDEPLATPTSADEDALANYLEDAIKRIGTDTDRLSTSIQLTAVGSQAYVDQPPYLHRIDEANVYDGGSAYEMKVQAGADVAQWGRAPDAETGRPSHIGAWDKKLYLWPVPDGEYTLDLQITYNGATGTNPQGVQDAPTIDTMVARVPPELDRALANYVSARWLQDTGKPQVAERPMAVYERDVREHKVEPTRQLTAERSYNPLGI